MILPIRMNRNYWIISVFLLIVAIACQSNEARRPVSRKSTSVLEKTIELNKKNLERENNLIEAYIQNDSLLQYKTTKKGFWYAYQKSVEQGEFPKKGDIVVYEQEVRNLANEILHSKEELGVQTYFVDKEHIINGLQEGLKLMKVGEEMKFIFSSYVAYSTSGDKSKKIGVHEPVINTIKLINIKNQNNEH